MRISLDSPKRPKITPKGLFSHLERSTNPKMAFDDFLVVTERLLFSTFIKNESSIYLSAFLSIKRVG